MQRRWTRIGKLFATGLLAWSGLACASRFSDELKRLDGLRASDPTELAAGLARLEANASALSPGERRWLRLLQDYRKVLRGEYGDALGDALVLYDQAPEPEIKFRAALLIANAAALTRDFTLGLRYLERALAMQHQITDPQVRSMGYSVAGTVYNQYGQYAMGLQNAEMLLATQRSGRWACVGRWLQLASLHGLGRPIDEEVDVQAAISLCSSLKEPMATNLIRSILAQRWAQEGKTRQAIALLEASLLEVNATGYTFLIGEVHSLLAKFRLEVGDVVLAEKHARTVVALKGRDPRWLANVTAHHVLYEIALREGDVAAALTEYRLYAEADKARLDDIKAREYAFQLSRHELNRKNQSIALLKSENRLLQLRQEVARRSAWNFRLAFALLLVLAASLGLWGWRARRTHRSLRTLADTDGLTGLANRRHFRSRSEAALATCAQQRRPACVLLLDLDHFKQINDQCGHSAGDWVLREVARVGRLHCREGDLFGRIGGEEFAMTLVDCDADTAMRIADACRRSIETIDPGAISCELAVAVSIGVVATSVSGYDYEVLIAHADAAMYRSKVAGRNRVTLFESPAASVPGQPVLLDRRNGEAMLKQY